MTHIPDSAAEAEYFMDNIDKADKLTELFEPLIKQYEAESTGRFLCGFFAGLLLAFGFMLEKSFMITAPLWLTSGMLVVAMFLGAVLGQTLGRHFHAVEAEEARQRLFNMFDNDKDAKLLISELFDDEPSYYRKVVRRLLVDYQKEFIAANGP